MAAILSFRSFGKWGNVVMLLVMQDFGKFLFIAGIVVALAGAWLWSGRGTGWLGRLPGDISYQKGDLHVYFPVATCILLSIVLSLLAWFWRR